MDLCDADYVGYTARQLFKRVAEHKNSAIGNHFHEAHGRRDLLNESHFKILRKCEGKFDCLVVEMLFIKKFKPNFSVQTDSILPNFLFNLQIIFLIVLFSIYTTYFYTFLT